MAEIRIPKVVPLGKQYFPNEVRFDDRLVEGLTKHGFEPGGSWDGGYKQLFQHPKFKKVAVTLIKGLLNEDTMEGVLTAMSSYEIVISVSYSFWLERALGTVWNLKGLVPQGKILIVAVMDDIGGSGLLRIIMSVGYGNPDDLKVVKETMRDKAKVITAPMTLLAEYFDAVMQIARGEVSPDELFGNNQPEEPKE